jgi:mono/diheme cytochrome c family protein
VKRIVLLTGVLFLLGSVVAACNTQTERPADGQSLIHDGEKLYLEYCAECHQVDGSGWSTLYPRLAGNPIVTLHDPEPIILTVKYGQGSMMPFRTKLSPRQIAAILSYIRNAWGNQAVPVKPKQVN